MSERDTREAGRASGEARRVLPTLAGEPAEEFRQDLMVRYPVRSTRKSTESARVVSLG
ncbi:hypothetical protein [Streptomyces sp. NPDC058766]|uniref:hypothetical protein n=1 Tax=Streptomyces sp. NPDC058766 TaxID=3346630 RepID=UPI00368A2F5F